MLLLVGCFRTGCRRFSRALVCLRLGFIRGIRRLLMRLSCLLSGLLSIALFFGYGAFTRQYVNFGRVNHLLGHKQIMECIRRLSAVRQPVVNAIAVKRAFISMRIVGTHHLKILRAFRTARMLGNDHTILCVVSPTDSLQAYF